MDPRKQLDDDEGAVNTGSNLFVTGINPRLTESDIARLFEKYGDVENCSIMTDPHTKESRGFGFVKMVTAEQADAAKEGLQGEVIEGRTLSIEKARRSRPRTPTPGKYFGPPKRGRFNRLSKLVWARLTQLFQTSVDAPVVAIAMMTGVARTRVTGAAVMTPATAATTPTVTAAVSMVTVTIVTMAAVTTVMTMAIAAVSIATRRLLVVAGKTVTVGKTAAVTAVVAIMIVMLTPLAMTKLHQLVRHMPAAALMMTDTPGRFVATGTGSHTRLIASIPPAYHVIPFSYFPMVFFYGVLLVATVSMRYS